MNGCCTLSNRGWGLLLRLDALSQGSDGKMPIWFYLIAGPAVKARDMKKVELKYWQTEHQQSQKVTAGPWSRVEINHNFSLILLLMAFDFFPCEQMLFAQRWERGQIRQVRRGHVVQLQGNHWNPPCSVPPTISSKICIGIHTFIVLGSFQCACTFREAVKWALRQGTRPAWLALLSYFINTPAFKLPLKERPPQNTMGKDTGAMAIFSMGWGRSA